MTRTRTITAGAIATALLLAAGSMLLPARATLRETIEIQAGPQVERTYAPLVGIDPSNRGVVDLTPSGCDDVPFCDHIPLLVVVPAGVAENDIVSVVIEVSWDDPSGSNDIDVFAYDNQQIQGSGYANMGRAVTSSNPEKLRISNAVLGEYNLVVRNMNGVNTGYTVKARLTTEKFESPVELLAPPPAKPADKPAEEATPAEALPPTPGPTTPTTLAPVASQADDDFDFGASDFEDQLEAPPVVNLDEQAAALETAEEDEPSGLSIAMAFIVLPLAVLSALGGFILRRRATIWGT